VVDEKAGCSQGFASANGNVSLMKKGD